MSAESSPIRELGEQHRESTDEETHEGIRSPDSNIPYHSPVEHSSDGHKTNSASPENADPASPDNEYDAYDTLEEQQETIEETQENVENESDKNDELENIKNEQDLGNKNEYIEELTKPTDNIDEQRTARNPIDDSDDEEMNITRKRIIQSDDENDNDMENTSVKKKNQLSSFSSSTSSSDASDSEENLTKKRGNLLDSDLSDNSDNGEKNQGGEEVGELMANIFGDDSDEEHVTGDSNAYRGQEEEEDGQPKDDFDNEEKDYHRAPPDDGWDFDQMMRKKKAERKRHRRRRGDGIDIINDDDGRISAMVEAMKTATKEDRIANSERKPAVKKRKLLPTVKLMLLRSEMFEALIENGMMSAVSDWLSPLPDKSLPALEIRTELLKLLQDFSRLDQGVLRQSGLGKAVMMLFKHPKETKQNKELAARLIREWSRPIFQLDTDFRAVTREERESRDQERMPEVKRRRLSMEAGPSSSKHEEPSLKPGEKGYIGRARVPKPSTKDYVVRPKHMIEGEFKGERKGKAFDRLQKTTREFKERTKAMKAKRLVQVSLEGRNLAI